MRSTLKTNGLVKKVPREKEVTASGLSIDTKILSKLRLVGVAYSHVEREWFPTEDAYKAEIEVVERASEVMGKLKELGFEVKGYEADEYILTNLLVDKPDVVINLVDTYKGKDRLSTSVPAALELLDLEYTGAGMQGFVIGNNRHLTKELLQANDIPTPPYQYVKRAGVVVKEELGLPLIVKLNESGGSVGINKDAVKETAEAAKIRAEDLLSTYKVPVIIEKFIDGTEVTAIVFDDGTKKHVFLGEKVFHFLPDGKHGFVALESYDLKDSYSTVKHTEYDDKISRYVSLAFTALKHKDYAKFDIRLDKNGVPFITDSNPNTAFGPSMGLPIMEVASLYGVKFEELLLSMLSKHAKNVLKKNGERAVA